MSRRRKELLLGLYVAAIITTGGFALYRFNPLPVSHEWLGAGFFVLLTLATEMIPINLPRGGGTVSVSAGVWYSAIMLFSPGVATWVAALGTFRRRELSGQVPWHRVLFNRAQVGLSVGLSTLVYGWLGGSPPHIGFDARSIGAMAAAGLTSFFINMSTVAMAISLSEGVPFWSNWLLNFRWSAPQYLALMPLGILIAIVYGSVGAPGVLLFFVPLLIARYSLQRYNDLRDIYLSTITALVRALEQKDPYTRGHSDRVKTYALAVAREMHVPADQLERLEYVALLHDVGKIGIRDTIWMKEGRLDQAEYEEIKRHSVVGAEIIGQIEILGHDVEIVRHHHEWFDGSGYPDSKAGKDIPIGARILAVADAFDAMTSERPYKPAYGYREAVEELNRYSGRQFDPEVVQAFLATVKEVIPSAREGVRKAV
ncbi:MAG: HD-GYP domain-containing protein [Bacillota bacterium]